jgi:hypothetical protein
MQSISKMSLGELRIFHAQHHGDYIWSCRYCKERYMELMEQKEDKNVSRKNSHQSLPDSGK